MADIRYRLVIEGEQTSVKAVENVDKAVDELDASVKQTSADLSKFSDELDSSADGAKKLDTSVDKLDDSVERLDSDVKQAEKGVSKFGAQMAVAKAHALAFQTGLGRVSEKAIGLGRTLSVSVTAPLLALGGASIKVASDFEASMTQIQTLVGLSAEQVAEFRGEVLALSGQTARAPQELADALFVVTSAGLRGSDALEVLDASAKASAIGLGETADIGRALTAVLQAYAGTGLTAAQATDQLVAVVREGNLEASSLAPALGRVIGIAANMGVSFAEVGANVATFTRLGVSAEQAITGIAGVLRAALKPASEQGKEALAAMGLEATYLRDVIAEKGLAGGLVDLMTKFKGNTDALSFIIPEIEAFSSVLGVAGAQAENYLQIEKSIIGANGLLEQGFATVANTTQFKLNASLVSLKQAGIRLGETLVPVFDQIAGAVQTAAGWFSSLSENQMKALTDIGKIALIAGPVILALGKIGAAISALGVTTGIATGGLSILIGALTAVTAALYLQEGGFDAFKNFAKASIDAVKSYFAKLPQNLLATANLLFNVMKAPFDFIALFVNDIVTQIVKMFGNLPSALLAAIKGNWGEAFDIMLSDFKSFSETVNDTWTKTMDNLGEQTFEFSEEFKENAEEVKTTAVTLGSAIKEALTFDIGGAGASQTLSAVQATTDAVTELTESFEYDQKALDDRMKAQTKSFISNLKEREKVHEGEVERFHKLENLKAVAMQATSEIVTQTTEQYVMSNIDRKQSAEEAAKGIANSALREMKVYLALTIATAVKKAFTSSLNPIAGAIMGAVATAAVTALFSQIPKFEKGGLVDGGRQLVEINERGQEFVVNAESTRQALPLLEAINDDPQSARRIVAEFSQIASSDRVYTIASDSREDSEENSAQISSQTSDRQRVVSSIIQQRARDPRTTLSASENRLLEIARMYEQNSTLDSSTIERLSSVLSGVTSIRSTSELSDRSDSSSTARILNAITSKTSDTRVDREDPESYGDRRASEIRDVSAYYGAQMPAMIQDEDEQELDVFERIRRAFFDRDSSVANRVGAGNDVYSVASISSGDDAFVASTRTSVDDIETARAARDPLSIGVNRYSDRSNAFAQSNAESSMTIKVEVTGKIENEVIRLANERAVTVQRAFS